MFVLTILRRNLVSELVKNFLSPIICRLSAIPSNRESTQIEEIILDNPE